jgi:hypothetical protein
MGNDSKLCEDLFFQMRQYKLNLVPYKEEFRNNNETPILWWLATDDTKNYLQQLALYILSVIPHSSSCKRVFSTFGWIYGKRRLRLQTSKVESMAKIRSFYVLKVNEELKYASSKYSQSKLKVMINESLDNLKEDFEENEAEKSTKEIVKQHEIPNHIVSVLILENIFDIKVIPFIKDSEDSDSDSDEDEDTDEDDDKDDDDSEMESENDEEPIMDYDVDELASKYFD